MSAVDEQDQIELRKAEQFIAETPAMDGIEGVRVQLGQDWAGDPALWLIFRLRKDLDADQQWMQQFIRYSGVIQTKILDSGLTRFPFKRLERAA